jgi:hypothetical protein
MRGFVVLASFCLAVSACSNKPRYFYQDSKLGVDQRTEDLLGHMTAQEKTDLALGHPNARLGIPALPLGSTGPSSDSLGIDLQATWNPDLVMQLARAEAAEQPVFDPKGGDPWLASRMAVTWVSGVQSAGGIAVLKGLRCGAGEREMQEEYLPPFRSAIEEAGLWAIDPGKCADDDALLSGTIEATWGFRGFFVGLHNDDPDDQARRILRAMFAAGMFDGETMKRDSAEQRRIKRTAQEQSVVLLRNEGGFLPLYASRARSIAVIGAKEQVDAIRARAGSTPVVEGNSPDAAVVIAFTGDRVFVGPAPLDSAKAPAMLLSQSAQGATDVIFGDANPSGRLPEAIEPNYPFGFGLSYTTFDWSALRIFPATPRYGQTVQVVVNVRNTGSRAGAETVEAYIHDRLKAFQRVELKPGEAKDVAMTLDRHSMSFYDAEMHDWGTRPGMFDVAVGGSARDVRLKGSFRLFQ